MLEDDVIKKEESEYTDDLEGGFEYQDLTEKTHRRRGGAFDMLARVLKGTKKIMFGSGIIMENRTGKYSQHDIDEGLIASDNVFELYSPEPAREGRDNMVFIGRSGKEDHGNTNAVIINVFSTGKEKSVANGMVDISVVDKESESLGSIQVAALRGVAAWEADKEGKPDKLKPLEEDSGTAIALTCRNGGAIQLMVAKGQKQVALILSEEGIELYGVPTTQPETPLALWNDGGTLKLTPPPTE